MMSDNAAVMPYLSMWSFLTEAVMRYQVLNVIGIPYEVSFDSFRGRTNIMIDDENASIWWLRLAEAAFITRYSSISLKY